MVIREFYERLVDIERTTVYSSPQTFAIV